jgi:lia operon protein LiaG
MTKRFMKKWASPLSLFLVALAVAVPRQGARGQEQERLQGSEVSIYNLAGRVEVLPGTGSDVTVQIVRGGGDAQRLEVNVREVDGRQALIIRYPDDAVIYPELGRSSRTQLRVRPDGTFGDRGSGRGDEVEVRGSGRGLEAWADLRISVPRGKDVAVYLAVGETQVGAVEGDLLIDTGSGAVHAQGGSGSLNVDTGSGAVTVRDFRGDLLVDTGSGDVDLSAIQGGEVSVDTGSGAVEGAGVIASYLKVDTGSGEIVLSGVSAPEVYLDTGSGQVDVELLEDVDELLVDTGSGGVTLRVPASLGAEIEVDTGSGGIDVNIPVEVREVKRNYMRGILGDGRGRIVVDTGSGGVRLIGG